MALSRPSPPRGARTRVSRRIAADPTSTALLLAAPAAVELWPGVRRVGEAGDRTLVETEVLPGGPTTAAAVRALPPRRTPTSYVTRFEWSGYELPATSATLTLAYAPAADGTVATHAALQLDSEGLEGSRLDAYGLQGLAQAFLDNLGQAAESRNQAA